MKVSGDARTPHSICIWHLYLALWMRRDHKTSLPVLLRLSIHAPAESYSKKTIKKLKTIFRLIIISGYAEGSSIKLVRQKSGVLGPFRIKVYNYIENNNICPYFWGFLDPHPPN